jgi:predicted RNA binding protein YcfA (HicA-like mRNA interferase family)
MPVKIRKLKSELGKAGFVWEPGKGSHTHWFYQHDRSIRVLLAGRDGDDAKPYQIKEVRDALKKAKEK